MKKIIAMLAAVMLMGMSMVALTAGSASATNDKPWICHPVNGKGETGEGWNLINPNKASSHIDEDTGAGKHTSNDGRTDKYAKKVNGKWTCDGGTQPPTNDNKSVTVCHFENGAYNRITVEATDWFNDHKSHSEDIWDAFTYIPIEGGNPVTVPKQGNTDLLNYEDCAVPNYDEEITPPALKVIDKCEAVNDGVEVVHSEDKTRYDVSPVTGTHPNFSVTVTAKDGFVFDEGKSITLTTSDADFPNNKDCDLPETGGDAQYNVNMGIAAVALLLLGAGTFLLVRRKS